MIKLYFYLRMLTNLRGVFLQYRFIYNYIQNKKFTVGKFERIFRVSWVTGNRGTFFGLRLIGALLGLFELI